MDAKEIVEKMINEEDVIFKDSYCNVVSIGVINGIYRNENNNIFVLDSEDEEYPLSRVSDLKNEKIVDIQFTIVNTFASSEAKIYDILAEALKENKIYFEELMI